MTYVSFLAPNFWGVIQIGITIDIKAAGKPREWGPACSARSDLGRLDKIRTAVLGAVGAVKKPPRPGEIATAVRVHTGGGNRAPAVFPTSAPGDQGVGEHWQSSGSAMIVE
jgi:hypothetical protein